MDDRRSDGHKVAWSPSLLSQTRPLPSVDGSSPNEDKLALFKSLFGARTDVYATHWESASTGKAGWSPATRGRWSRQRAHQDYLPLNDDVFAAHLLGRATVGIYPLLPGDTCALLACDFDKGSWLLDALAYLDACHANGVPAALERSRSGNGGHVWVFFDGLVPAADARAMGAALLRQAMSARAELDLSSYDRFFPSQDFLPKGRIRKPHRVAAAGRLRPAGKHAVPRPDDAGAMARSVVVPVFDRAALRRRRLATRRVVAARRCRPGAQPRSAGTRRWAIAAGGH